MTYSGVDVVPPESFRIVSIEIQQLRNIIAGVVTPFTSAVAIRPCSFLRSIIMTNRFLTIKASVQCKFQSRQELESIINLEVGKCTINNRAIISLLHPR